MQAQRTLTPGQKGTKKFLERYGDQLVCVRYRYDDQRRKRFTTIEIIVEESSWSPPEKPEIVGLRVEFQETELQRRVKQAGGKCNSTMRVWEIHYDQAVALGLKKRIVMNQRTNGEEARLEKGETSLCQRKRSRLYGPDLSLLAIMSYVGTSVSATMNMSFM